MSGNDDFCTMKIVSCFGAKKDIASLPMPMVPIGAIERFGKGRDFQCLLNEVESSLADVALEGGQVDVTLAPHGLCGSVCFTSSGFQPTTRVVQPNYETWLNQIVAAFQTHTVSKDRTFSRFLLDLPHVPPDVLSLLRESCIEPERFVHLICLTVRKARVEYIGITRRQMGFSALREFVSQRPSLRDEAMTTHPDKITRGAAINTHEGQQPKLPPRTGMEYGRGWSPIPSLGDRTVIWVR
ncbi:hypothetical protein C8Q74DRAFT_1222089 [Fomes fomentarius]|nr:hypothetical protein C8Q74DRAFT_1222089 [Fomes fomentarius]